MAFSLGLQKQARGHRTDSLPNFNACHAKGQRVDKTLKQEEPIFPSGCLAQYIGGSTEKRLPMPVEREGTDYFLTGKCKKPETESVLLLETFCSLFSSEDRKGTPNRV